MTVLSRNSGTMQMPLARARCVMGSEADAPILPEQISRMKVVLTEAINRYWSGRGSAPGCRSA